MGSLERGVRYISEAKGERDGLIAVVDLSQGVC